MRDLSGVDDSDAGFGEIDTMLERHVRETIERAVRTRRGTIREFPDNYVDLSGFVNARSAEVPLSTLEGAIQEDLQIDPRFRSAVATLTPPTSLGRVRFRVEATMADGTVLTFEGSA